MRVCSKTASAVFLGCVLLLSGCSALRIPAKLKKPFTHGRHTLGIDSTASVNWGNFDCSGMSNIGFSTSYKAVEVPSNGVIMGQVQIHNRGFEPFEFRTPGFRLTGTGGFMDSAMKCPDNQIPAGGVMQCGFAAPALDTATFTSFQPFFVPRTSAFPCFCNQPYSIETFSDPIFDDSPDKSFADAVADTFGVPEIHETMDKLESWKGNPLALAQDIVDSIFSTIANTNFQLSAQLGDSSLDISTGFLPRKPENAAERPAGSRPINQRPLDVWVRSPVDSKANTPTTHTKPAQPVSSKVQPVPTKVDTPATQTKPAEPMPSKVDAPMTPTKPAEPAPTKTDVPSMATKPAEPSKADAPAAQPTPAEPVSSKVEPVPTKTVVPSTPTKPAEPAPTKVDTPVTPTKPAEPTKADAPTQAKPAEPVPTKAEAPVTQTKPAEPSKADAPVTKPAEPVPTKVIPPSTPSKPAEPVSSKVEPVPTKADTPATQAKPSEPMPTKSAEPTKAAAPVTETKPAEPMPAKAVAPSTPAKPAEPAPSKVNGPATVVTETKPAQPVPTKVDTPATPTKPAEPMPAKAPSTPAPVADKVQKSL